MRPHLYTAFLDTHPTPTGVMRGCAFPLSTALCTAPAHQTDRLFVALDQRPWARGAVMLYIALLHMYALVG